jgi:hypothetical protein
MPSHQASPNMHVTCMVCDACTALGRELLPRSEFRRQRHVCGKYPCHAHYPCARAAMNGVHAALVHAGRCAQLGGLRCVRWGFVGWSLHPSSHPLCASLPLIKCKERNDVFNVCWPTHLNSAWSPAIAAAVGASSFIVRA